MIKSAFEFEAIVSPNGTIEVAVPVPPGTKVEVLVLTSDDGDCSDLVSAASANLGFWDNPWDDEDWNNA
jgi:hypothetical protein